MPRTILGYNHANTASTKGGGIKQSSGTLNIKNSIISDQTAGGNCVGTINSIAGSFASDTTCTGTSNTRLLALTLTGTPAYYLLATTANPAKDVITPANCTAIGGILSVSPAQNNQTRPTLIRTVTLGPLKCLSVFGGRKRHNTECLAKPCFAMRSRASQGTRCFILNATLRVVLCLLQ